MVVKSYPFKDIHERNRMRNYGTRAVFQWRTGVNEADTPEPVSDLLVRSGLQDYGGAGSHAEAVILQDSE